MNGKSHISLKTKKILLGTGITFGTILVFVMSFFLSFNFIINPISFSTFGSGDVAAENEELKNQVQTLEDEVEHLNAAVEKYKNNVNTPAPPANETIPTTTVPPKTDAIVSETTPSGVTNTGESTPVTNSNPSDSGSNADADEDKVFTPDTVTTPEGGFEPEVEEDITVIDVSE